MKRNIKRSWNVGLDHFLIITIMTLIWIGVVMFVSKTISAVKQNISNIQLLTNEFSTKSQLIDSGFWTWNVYITKNLENNSFTLHYEGELTKKIPNELKILKTWTGFIEYRIDDFYKENPLSFIEDTFFNSKYVLWPSKRGILMWDSIIIWNIWTNNWINKITDNWETDLSFNNLEIPTWNEISSISRIYNNIYYSYNPTPLSWNWVLKSTNMDFNTGLWFTWNILTTIKTFDNRILVWGNMIEYNWSVINWLVKLKNNWEIDTTFNTGGINVWGIIYNISKSIDGKYILSWLFNQYNWNIVSNVVNINWNGEYIPSNIWEFDSIVTWTIDIWNNYYVSYGNFNSYSWKTVNKIVKYPLYCNSWCDEKIKTTKWIWPNNSVMWIIQDWFGWYFIWGNFTEYDWIPVNNIVRTNWDFEIDQTFSFNKTWWVYDVLVKKNSVYIMGNFAEWIVKIDIK